jgi:hypothetical protein
MIQTEVGGEEFWEVSFGDDLVEHLGRRVQPPPVM